MQYTVELLELWWACLTAAMKDRSLAFPLSVVIGLVLGALFWWLAALSARLWNRRFYMNPALQILCGAAALLAVVFAMTYVSAKNLETAIIASAGQWKDALLSDGNQAWRQDSFYRAWDAVADTKMEPTVTRSNNPRINGEDKLLSMGHPDAKQAVVRVYVDASRENFKTVHPYLSAVLFADSTNDVPKGRMDQSIVDWFRQNAGSPYPIEIAIALLADHITEVAKHEAPAAAAYTERVSVALFLITQLLVFVIIGFVAHRSNRPAVEGR
jgi:hypothetical protein